ncbi:hypothetical protein EPA93_40355 [Ktedonosporobacter rubrisoli]|uniref:Uncharacterized protein n=1 Tax=Ktedonosporobacter rubrisoli TaxID=2509675 RepID=A0A4P6K166_KTERU|nr:hypothetical protein [Ktedonosporobacter rubrisoli]QBD81897.1 hypothetical protein EPA93_40355 [Ktedonosporobacter rubrisoli]
MPTHRQLEHGRDSLRIPPRTSALPPGSVTVRPRYRGVDPALDEYDIAQIPTRPEPVMWQYESSDYIAESSLPALSLVKRQKSARLAIDEIDTLPPGRAGSSEQQDRRMWANSATLEGCTTTANAQETVADYQALPGSQPSLQARTFHSSAARSTFDWLRWWLLYPGRIERVLWLVGTVLLVGVTGILLSVSLLNIGIAGFCLPANSGRSAARTIATPAGNIGATSTPMPTSTSQATPTPEATTAVKATPESEPAQPTAGTSATLTPTAIPVLWLPQPTPDVGQPQPSPTAGQKTSTPEPTAVTPTTTHTPAAGSPTPTRQATDGATPTSSPVSATPDTTESAASTVATATITPTVTQTAVTTDGANNGTDALSQSAVLPLLALPPNWGEPATDMLARMWSGVLTLGITFALIILGIVALIVQQRSAAQVEPNKGCEREPGRPEA